MVTASSEPGCRQTAVLNSFSAFSRLIVQPVEPPEQQRGFLRSLGSSGDLLVLLDGALQDFLRLRARLHIAQRADKCGPAACAPPGCRDRA